MSQNRGTLVTAAIRPNDSLDPIASAFANEIKGGLHTVDNIIERDEIIEARREWGMLCYVKDDKAIYQLKYLYSSDVIMDNNNWDVFSGGSGGGGEWLNSVLEVLMIEPTEDINNNDRYLVGLNSSDIISGSNWGAKSGGFIAQYVSVMEDWIYTEPTDGMSVRVDIEDNVIYRYEGIYPDGAWQRDRVNQVRYISATTSDGINYTSNSSPIFSSYDKEMLFIVKFLATNGTASAYLNINDIENKPIKKISGYNVYDVMPEEISTNYQYLITYNGSYFEMLNPTMVGYDLNNQTYIPVGEKVTVPLNTQYWVYGDLTIDGQLDNYGDVVIVNGGLTNEGNLHLLGTSSTHRVIYFAEIDGLATKNYLPKWTDEFLLSGTSSIYDDGNEVTISSPTFSVEGSLTLPKGATTNYVLTSDSEGNATWQPSVRKYTGTMSISNGVEYTINHNLNTDAIIVSCWDEINGDEFKPDIKRVDLDNIKITSSNSFVNARFVIIG